MALTGDKIYWLIFTSTFENQKACCGDGGKNKRSLSRLLKLWCSLRLGLILLPLNRKVDGKLLPSKTKSARPLLLFIFETFCVVAAAGGAHQMRRRSSSTHLTRAVSERSLYIYFFSFLSRTHTQHTHARIYVCLTTNYKNSVHASIVNQSLYSLTLRLHAFIFLAIERLLLLCGRRLFSSVGRKIMHAVWQTIKSSPLCLTVLMIYRITWTSNISGLKITCT